MGSKRKYTPSRLRREIARYLASISRTVDVTEPIDSGKRDKYGHVIYDYIPVKNDLGETIRRTEYLIPPTIGGICGYLRIHESTWNRWKQEEKYAEITAETKGILRTWRLEQLHLRKDVKGLIFDLQNNYDMEEKRVVELGRETRQAIAAATMTMEEKERLLREIAQEWGEHGGEPEA